MASYDPTRKLAGSTLTGGPLSALISALVGNVASWNDARLTRNALSKLTDHELYDLGLSRADVERM